MSKKSRVSFGPGAASLILIMVILSMSILGMLGLISAKNDKKLSERSVAVTESVYALNAAAERTYADLSILALRCAQNAQDDAGYAAAVRDALPDGMTMEERTIRWTQDDGMRTLELAVELLPLAEADGESAGDRLRWTEHRLRAVTGNAEEADQDPFAGAGSLMGAGSLTGGSEDGSLMGAGSLTGGGTDGLTGAGSLTGNAADTAGSLEGAGSLAGALN